MSPKKPNKVLSPQEERDLAPLLQEAERMAKAGFDPVTKKLDPNIYGPTSQKFDLNADMQNPLPVIQMEQQALEAVEVATNEQFINTSSPKVEAEQEFVHRKDELKSEEEVDSDDPPEDPMERVKWTAAKLQKFNPKAPNENVLFKWKQMHGNIFVLSISDFVFIYRYLKRQEWIQIQLKPEWENMTNDQQERMLVFKCLLWPILDPITEAGLPANAIGMLLDQIRMQSMFLNPQVVAGMTLKL